jgi:hypothetical protein
MILWVANVERAAAMLALTAIRRLNRVFKDLKFEDNTFTWSRELANPTIPAVPEITDALAAGSVAASQKTSLERWRLATCVANPCPPALCGAPLGK